MRNLKLIIKCLHGILYFGSIILPVLSGAHSAVCKIDSALNAKKEKESTDENAA